MATLLNDQNAPELAATDSALIDQILQGNQQAAEVLYHRYADRLRVTVARRVGNQFGSRFDADDVVQSAFRLFYENLQHQRIDVPEGRDLWNFLSVLALNKLRDQLSHHQAARRSIHLTETIPLHTLSRTEPSQAEALVQLRLVVNEYLKPMEPWQREVVELRMLGHEIEEIARQVGRSKRTVERLLQTVRGELHSMIFGDETPG